MSGAFEDSEFRTSNRKRLLRGLFFETTPTSDKTNVLYSLKDEDHLGYRSLSRLYLEANDPTEYTFAVQYLESYDHWEMLCECSWFKPYLNRWRKELEMKIKSEALANIIREAKDQKSPSRFAANKYIIEKGWEPKDTPNKKGRPSKDAIREAAYDIAETERRLQEDFDRLQRPN